MQLHKGIEDFKAGKANDKDAKLLADKSVASPTPLAKDTPNTTKRAVSQRCCVGIGNRRAAEASGNAASGGSDGEGGGSDSESEKSEVQKMDAEMVQVEDGGAEGHSDDGGRRDIISPYKKQLETDGSLIGQVCAQVRAPWRVRCRERPIQVIDRLRLRVVRMCGSGCMKFWEPAAKCPRVTSAALSKTSMRRRSPSRLSQCSREGSSFKIDSKVLVLCM